MTIGKGLDINNNLFPHLNAPFMGGRSYMREQDNVIKGQQLWIDLAAAFVDIKPCTGEFLFCNIRVSAFSSTTSPRDVLTRTASGFINFSRRAFIMKCGWRM